ncbi:F5/8 type C domain-containing protein [Azospirillaceae bacterium]
MSLFRLTCRAVLLTFLIAFAPFAVVSAGDRSSLELLAGARIAFDGAGKGVAYFGQGRSAYFIDRSPDGATDISDALSRRFNNVRVRDVAVLHFADGWTYVVASGRWQEPPGVRPSTAVSSPVAAPRAGQAPVIPTSAVIHAPVVPQPKAVGEIVGLKLVNRSGGPVRSQVTTFGHVFAAGAVKPGDSLVARIGKQATATQVDVKTRHPDGSVRHAVLSFSAPALPANGSVDVMLASAPSGAPAAALTAEALLARGYSFSMRLNLLDGGPRDVDVADLLRQAIAAGRLDLWLSGPLAVEVRVESRITPLLRAVFDIRGGADGRTRTSVMVANDATWTPGAGTMAYRAEILAGGRPELAASISHYRAANWRRVIGAGAGDLTVIYDVDYFIRTGALPPFDVSLGVDAAALQESALALAKANTKPLGNALIVQYMPTTGARSDIGITPAWTANYLISQDARAQQAMYANAEASGSVPWHFHDETTGQYVRIDQHPRFWLDARAAQQRKEGPATPLAAIEKDTGWTTDDAHTPSLAFVPYLLSGDRYYLDEAHAVGAWRLASSNPDYRQNCTYKQVRALAWELRDLGNIAYATPDNHPLKSYFTTQINKELDLLRETYLGRRIMSGAKEVEGWFMGDSSRDPGQLRTWQFDFMAVVLAELNGQGFSQASPLLDWSANFIVGRFLAGAQGFDPFYGPSYTLKLFDPTTHALLSSWREVFAASFPGALPRSDFLTDAYPKCSSCFVAVAKASLAGIISVTGSLRAVEAYDFLVRHTPPEAMPAYRKESQWALRPRLSDGRYVPVGTPIGSAKQVGR